MGGKKQLRRINERMCAVGVVVGGDGGGGTVFDSNSALSTSEQTSARARVQTGLNDIWYQLKRDLCKELEFY